jgi:fucose 4-O-acetylase-like acetyltransferase
MAQHEKIDVSNMAPISGGRNAHWDNARGLAIIAVVGIHATTLASTFPPESLNFIFATILRQFIDFAVPLFLAIAGYFSGLRPLGSPIAFVRNRALRILPPYVVWSLLYLLVFRPSDLASPFAVIRHLVTGTGVIIGYFVVVLSQMVVLTPLIDAIKSKYVQIAALILLTAAGLTFTYIVAVRYSGSTVARFPYYALPFVVWYPFYHLGFLAAKWQLADRIGSRKWNLIFLACWAAGIAASLIEAFWLVDQGLTAFAGSQIKATSIAASLALFLLFLSSSRSASLNHEGVVSQLGKDSFFIYFLHLLAFSGAETALGKLDYVVNHQVLYVALLVLLALGACIMAAQIARAVLPPRWRLLLLGL